MIQILLLLKKVRFFYKELIVKCLDPNPSRRPTANQIEQVLLLYHQNHSFIDQILNEHVFSLNKRN